MRNKLVKLLLLGVVTFALQGCVAVVKDGDHNPTNREIMQRLDAMDHRLHELEEKAEKK